MNEKAENLLNELVSKIGTAEEFEQVQKQLFRRGVEALLNAEDSFVAQHKLLVLFKLKTTLYNQKWQLISQLPS